VTNLSGQLSRSSLLSRQIKFRPVYLAGIKAGRFQGLQAGWRFTLRGP